MSPSTAVTSPTGSPARRLDAAADQVVPVEHARRAAARARPAGTRSSRPASASASFIVSTPSKRDDRAAPCEPRIVGHAQRCRRRPPRCAQQHGARPETAPRRSRSPGSRSPGRGCRARARRARRATKSSQSLRPARRRGPSRLVAAPGSRASPCARGARPSPPPASAARTPSGPAARSRARGRPGATNSSITVTPRCVRLGRRARRRGRPPARARSTSTTSRAWLTARPPPAPAARRRLVGDVAAPAASCTVLRRARARLQPVGDALVVHVHRRGLRPRVVVAHDLHERGSSVACFVSHTTTR